MARRCNISFPSGPFAMLPLTGNRSSIVWTEEGERGKAIMAADEDRFLDELTKRFGFRLGEIALAGPRQSFPLDFRSPAHSWRTAWR